MEEDLARFTLRTDRELLRKFRYIAGHDGRSANKELERYLKQRVAEYEEEFG